jgi:hypothetical protein
MATFQELIPPAIQDGKYLSAYWVNQLGAYVSSACNFVFGANVLQWSNATYIDINGVAGMYSFEHKYDTLRLMINVQHAMHVKVRLAKVDTCTSANSYAGSVQALDNHYTSTGLYTVDINLTTVNGFSLATDELYFAYVEFDHDSTSSSLSWITRVEEASDSLIDPPSPAIATLSASTIITKAYLDTLRAAALNLYGHTVPTNLPFCGVAVDNNQSRDGTYMRWTAKHVNRYLHISYAPALTGDGGTFYLDNQALFTFNQGGAATSAIYDMQALPNSIAEPTLGDYYEMKVATDVDTGTLKVFYIWELPYQ